MGNQPSFKAEKPCSTSPKVKIWNEESWIESVRQQNYAEIKAECVRRGQLWEDPLFTASRRSLGLPKSANVTWLRPQDICLLMKIKQAPTFLNQAGTPKDLVGGTLGSPWFAAGATMLHEHPGLFKRIVGTAEQSFQSEDYCGIFHFRFYHFGAWTDVCVDDRLPLLDNELKMTRSKFLNCFWTALLEKAFAK